jgi:hypothetical protein
MAIVERWFAARFPAVSRQAFDTQPLTPNSANALAVNQACSKKKHIGNLMRSWHLSAPNIHIYDKKELMLLGRYAHGGLRPRPRRVRQ